MSNLEPYELSSKDKSDPDSLISRLPSLLALKLGAVPNEVLEMSDDELRKLAKVSVDVERLRIALWQEYERANRTNTSMQIGNIFSGLCPREAFLNRIIQNSYTMAYMCRPPLNIAIAIEEALLLSIEQMRSILLHPHVDERGRFDGKAASLKLQLYKELHARAKGMVVQKVEQKNLHLHADADTPLPKSVDEINKRLAELESKTDITPVLQITGDLE